MALTGWKSGWGRALGAPALGLGRYMSCQQCIFNKLFGFRYGLGPRVHVPTGGLVGLALQVHRAQARGALSMGNIRLCKPRIAVALDSLHIRPE